MMKKLICLVLSMLIILSAVPACALSYDELLRKAEDYVTAEDYEKAFACYDLAVKSAPSNAIAYTKAAALFLEKGEVSVARDSIEKALSIDTTSPDAWLVKCRLDLAVEDVAALDSDILYAEICDADLSEYTADIGDLYAKSGYANKAIEFFSQVPVKSLNDSQRANYRRALLSLGEKEKVVALGLYAEQIRNEKLDAAFDSGNPRLSETGSAIVKPQVSDFEISDEAKDALKEAGNGDDIDASLAKALNETDFVLFSKSPAGNSGIIAAGDSSAVTMYNGKYHLVYPSAKGVPDEYSNLKSFSRQFYSGFRSLVGEEGIVYSADGRYAAICNKRFTLINMNLFLDPILIDLSTGELILTATYPDKIKEENAGAISSAVFSSDNRYFYYILYGLFGENRTRLYRYVMNTGDTELCLESEKNLYYPRLAELEDGSLLMINDCYKIGETQGLVIASCDNGVWSLEETKLQLDRKYCYAGGLTYSSNSGLVCLLENAGGSYSVAFQVINPNKGFEGIDKFWCVRKDTNEIVSLSPEEYQASIDTDTKDREGEIILSLLYSNQTILNAVFSPDGNYLLLNTLGNSVEGKSRNLFLIRLEDMTLQKVSGLDAEKIMVSTLGRKYPMNIEWNTDELIIGTDDGIKTFEFTAGN